MHSGDRWENASQSDPGLLTSKSNQFIFVPTAANCKFGEIPTGGL